MGEELCWRDSGQAYCNGLGLLWWGSSPWDTLELPIAPLVRLKRPHSLQTSKEALSDSALWIRSKKGTGLGVTHICHEALE